MKEYFKLDENHFQRHDTIATIGGLLLIAGMAYASYVLVHKKILPQIETYDRSPPTQVYTPQITMETIDAKLL